MSASTTARWLSEAIGQATKSAKFCVSNCLPVVDPGMVVDGLGAIKLPLKPATAKKLVAHCQVAPYGKGTQTLVDKKVRDTLELDPKKFRLSQEWNAAVARAAQLAAEQLGGKAWLSADAATVCTFIVACSEAAALTMACRFVSAAVPASFCAVATPSSLETRGAPSTKASTM